MKKLVRTSLVNTPNRRGIKDLNIQFYSHDKNNAGFEFVIKNETDLSEYTAKVLFHFVLSDSTWESAGTIEGNVVKATFNTDLIARCEEVLGFLFLDSESNSLDVFKFKFNVVLSEIDKNEVEKRKIKHVADIEALELVTRSELREELAKIQVTGGVDLSDYLTTIVAEATYVKKTDLPAPYNDSALVSRVSALENKQDKDTVYDDTKVKERLTALESKPTVDTSNFLTKNELNTLRPLPTLTINNNTLSISGGNSVMLPTNQREIHGTGMPNGVVEAEIGTTYVDKNKTNGALKWIKTTNGGNQGWEVLIGDTGWRTLNSTSKLKVGDRTSYIKIRRVNNLVTYQFGGLQWGWFGIIRRNGAGFLKHNSSGDKGAKVLGVSGIPEGFRSESSLIGGIYSDTGKSYGIWYLGGKSDSNFIQFTFNDPIPTDRDIGDIRVSAISYLTEEPWPTQLP